jgi:phage shock protein C
MTAAPGLDDINAGYGAVPRRLYRSRTNRTFAGVCAGIAEYFGSDPTAVRVLAVILAIFTAIFPLLIAYLVAAVVIPERPGELAEAPAAASTGSPLAGRGVLVFGGLLIAVGVLALINEVFRVDWDLLWPFLLVGAGAAILLAGLRR